MMLVDTLTVDSCQYLLITNNNILAPLIFYNNLNYYWHGTRVYIRNNIQSEINEHDTNIA